MSDKKLKVGIDNTAFFPIVGGTETYCYQLLNYAAPNVADLRLFTHIPLEGPIEVNGYPVLRMGQFSAPEGYDKGSEKYDEERGLNRIIRTKGEAEKVVKKVRQDPIVARYFEALLSFQPDVLLVNDVMRVISFPYLQLLPLLAENTTLVLNFHGILTSFNAFWDERPQKKELLKQLISNYPRSIYFLCPSQYVYDVTLDWGVPPANLKRIYLGIDTSLFKPVTKEEKGKLLATMREKFPEFKKLDHGDTIIGFPSRAVSHKGVDTALSALKSYLENAGKDKKWRFLIAGGSSDNLESIAHTRSIIESFGMEDRVVVGVDRFLDYPRDMTIFYQLCDLCLFPSRREAFGYAAIESMSSGVPVIGTSIPGLNEAMGAPVDSVGECPGGWVVQCEDANTLAQQLSEVLDRPELLKSKRESVRSWVINNFSVERMVREHLEFFVKIKS